MMFLRFVRLLTALVVLAAIATVLLVLAARRPEALPWTPLDLAAPIGMFTGRKIAALAEEGPRCRDLLARAGMRFTRLPALSAPGGRCGYGDAVRPRRGGAREIDYAPANLGVACPVAAALAVWEWQVVQPAALRHFGRPVDRIDHYGSYSCRRIYGRDAGAWSEHARANAIDIAGFRLGATRITVARDWRRGGAKAAFLREVRDGACRIFATTLSPDYNAAHADHFHLDEAPRGAGGWRACR